MNAPVFESVDSADLASCVSCGLCLPHCPTYRISGLDSHSPRGRIALVEAVRDGRLALDHEVEEALDSCVQCMGCLPACPSSVPYDRIIHPVVDELARARRGSRLWRSLVFLPLGRPALLRTLTKIAWVTQRLSLMPKRFSVPRLSFARRRPVGGRVPGVGNQVELLTGCVMGEWFGGVHQDTVRVLNQLGFDVRPTPSNMCCGALHSHAGLSARARKLLGRLVNRHEPCATLVTNSAGCGAHLVANGTNAVDVMDFIAEHLKEPTSTSEPSGDVPRERERVLVHDACHLRNVLGRHTSTHEVLSRWYEVVAIPDDGLCCGAGGAYGLWRPNAARTILERKFDAMRSLDLEGVAFMSSGNPGCTGHITAHLPAEFAAIQVVHPIQLVARMLVRGQHERQG